MGLLPRHRCCAGSCHGVEPRDNREAWENKHSLEGLWKGYNGCINLIHTVRGKPGYLFGTKLFAPGCNVPAIRRLH